MDLSAVQDFIVTVLTHPISGFLFSLGLVAALIRSIATRNNLRKASKDVAVFVDQYGKYDPVGAAQLDKTLIEWHKISIEELEKNKTK